MDKNDKIKVKLPKLQKKCDKMINDVSSLNMESFMTESQTHTARKVKDQLQSDLEGI